MRNLKRTLCLVMAAVMMLGMMVIGAGAVSYNDLLDKDQIVHEEAVATMNALGLIEGRDNGNFDPTAFITRAEMCKVITLALHGGTDPVLGTSSSTFWDTEGHWAETYIEYCAANGIIAGRGDGSFDPNSNITGTEAAKMILVALGYKSDVFIFTGPDWAINVDTRANDAYARLYDDLGGLNSSAAINRDNAAQMLYNGVIKAKMLIMTPSQSITSGDVTYNWTWKGTMLNEKFDAHVYEGLIVANEYAYLPNAVTANIYTTIKGSASLQNAGEFYFQPILVDEMTLQSVNASSSTYNAVTASNFEGMKVVGDTTLDMLGKTYKAIIKNTVKGGVHTTVYGELIYSDLNRVYTVSSDKTTDIMSETTFANEVRASGISDLSKAKAIYNFNGSTPNTRDHSKLTGAIEFSDLQGITENGTIIEVVDVNNDGSADYILVYAPIIGQITTYNSNGNSGAGAITVAVKGGDVGNDAANYITSAKFGDILTYDNLGMGDIVSYVLLPSSLYYVESLEAVSGSVTAQTNADTIKLDTTQYKQSDLSSYVDESNNSTLRDATTLGKDATFYLDRAGFVVYVDSEESGYNYLYLSAVEGIGTVSGVKAKVVFEDGTASVISIKSITQLNKKIYVPGAGSGEEELIDDQYLYSVNPAAFNKTADEGGNWDPAGIFKYTLNNGQYELTAVSEGKISAGTVLKGQAQVANNSVYALADNRTIFIVKDSASNTYSATVGVGNITSSAKEGANGFFAYDNVDGSYVIEFVVLTGTGNTSSSTKSVYILSDEITTTKSGDNTIYTVKALVDGVYNGALELTNTGGDIDDTSKVLPGLYTGSGIEIVNGKLNYLWVRDDGVRQMPTKEDEKTHEVSTTGFYTDPTYLASYENGVLTTTIDEKYPVSVTTNNSTKVIIITGSEEDEIYLDQDLSNIAYDKTNTVEHNNPSKNSIIAVVRGNTDSSKDGYYQASIVYIIRK